MQARMPFEHPDELDQVVGREHGDRRGELLTGLPEGLQGEQAAAGTAEWPKNVSLTPTAPGCVSHVRSRLRGICRRRIEAPEHAQAVRVQRRGFGAVAVVPVHPGSG